MAKVLMAPIKAVTVGGFDAVVDGVDVVSTDLLMGKVYTSHYTEGKNVSWDSNGICRDNDSVFNLSVNDSGDIEDFLQAAVRLNGR